MFPCVFISASTPQDVTQRIIEEYSPSYCQELESVYGEGMMSEGGPESIENMFKDILLEGKKALDIGCGLGGVAFHLANTHSTNVIGLDINPWMIKKATQNTPQALKDKVHFIVHQDDKQLPFEDSAFDIIYSKGVLTHVENKADLFREIYRILKPDGVVVIEDWLSPRKGIWGPNVRKMMEIEGLTLFADTIENYMKVLLHSGLCYIKSKNVSDCYAKYNRDIVTDLTKRFPENKSLIEGYQAIANALESGELLTIRFRIGK